MQTIRGGLRDVRMPPHLFSSPRGHRFEQTGARPNPNGTERNTRVRDLGPLLRRNFSSFRFQDLCPPTEGCLDVFHIVTFERVHMRGHSPRDVQFADEALGNAYVGRWRLGPPLHSNPRVSGSLDLAELGVDPLLRHCCLFAHPSDSSSCPIAPTRWPRADRRDDFDLARPLRAFSAR